MKVQRYHRKLFLTTVKTIQCFDSFVPASGMKVSYINTREIHPDNQAVSLSGPARLPYKQALKEHLKAVSTLNKGKSALAEHVCDTKHKIALETLK
jgi:hypothetical protein